MLLFSDILCVQEHFILAGDKKHKNTDKLLKLYGKNHDMYIVPAFKNINQVSRGRGSGGMATIWKKSLTKYVTKIPCDNYRIQGTKFDFRSTTFEGNKAGCFLLLNTYFMCKPTQVNFDEGPLLSLLTDIKRVIDLADCPNILWCGDLNTDMTSQSNFTAIIRQFIDDLKLIVFWSNPINSPGLICTALPALAGQV